MTTSDVRFLRPGRLALLAWLWRACLFPVAGALAGCEQATLEQEGPDGAGTLQAEAYTGDMRLAQVQLRLARKGAGAEGLGLVCTLQLSRFHRLLFHDFDDLDYPAYLLRVAMLTPDGKPVPERSATQPLKPLVREAVLAGSFYQHPQLFIPYRLMGLPAGTHEIVLQLSGFPATVSRQSGTYKASAKTVQTTAPADLQVRLKLRLLMPKVYKAQLRVLSVEVDEERVDPHAFDYRLTGPGYPDLCWQLFLGPDRIWKSAVLKNRLRFRGESESPVFFVGPQDEVRLQICDDDEMTAPDLIGQWRGRLTDLRPDQVLQFDSVKNVRLEAVLSEP